MWTENQNRLARVDERFAKQLFEDFGAMTGNQMVWCYLDAKLAIDVIGSRGSKIV